MRYDTYLCNGMYNNHMISHVWLSVTLWTTASQPPVWVLLIFNSGFFLYRSFENSEILQQYGEKNHNNWEVLIKNNLLGGNREEQKWLFWICLNAHCFNQPALLFQEQHV